MTIEQMLNDVMKKMREEFPIYSDGTLELVERHKLTHAKELIYKTRDDMIRQYLDFENITPEDRAFLILQELDCEQAAQLVRRSRPGLFKEALAAEGK